MRDIFFLPRGGLPHSSEGIRACGAVCLSVCRRRRPQGYAIVMAILFPAGIPLTYLAVLYMGKERINPEPTDPQVSLKKREEDATIQKTK